MLACVVVLVIIRSEPFLDGERAVFVLVRVVGEDEDSVDPHNCTIFES